MTFQIFREVSLGLYNESTFHCRAMTADDVVYNILVNGLQDLDKLQLAYVEIPADAKTHTYHGKYACPGIFCDKLYVTKVISLKDWDKWEDPEFCRRAITKNALCYYFIRCNIDVDFDKLASAHPHAIGIIPNPSLAQYTSAVNTHPSSIQHVPEDVVGYQKLALHAVTCYGMFLEHVKNPCEEVCYAAIRNAADAIKFVPNPSAKMVLSIVKAYPQAIQYYPKNAEFPTGYRLIVSAAYSADPKLVGHIRVPSTSFELTALLYAVHFNPNIVYWMDRAHEHFRKALEYGISIAALDLDRFTELPYYFEICKKSVIRYPRTILHAIGLSSSQYLELCKIVLQNPRNACLIDRHRLNTDDCRTLIAEL